MVDHFDLISTVVYATFEVKLLNCIFSVHFHFTEHYPSVGSSLTTVLPSGRTGRDKQLRSSDGSGLTNSQPTLPRAATRWIARVRSTDRCWCPGTCFQMRAPQPSGCQRLVSDPYCLLSLLIPWPLDKTAERNSKERENTFLISFVPCLLAGCSQITCIDAGPLRSGGNSGERYPNDLSSNSRPQLYLQLQYLDLTDCVSLEDTGIQMIVRSCAQLTCLYLRRCAHITGRMIVTLIVSCVPFVYLLFLLFYTDLGVKYLASYCTALRELSISDCVQVTDFGMYELARLGPNLRYLSVAKCDQISDAGIKQIGRHCYKLRYLNLRGCEAVSDDSLEVLARTCSRLRALDLGKCDITDRGLRMLAEHCPNLKKLSVKSCELVTDEGVRSVAYYCRGLRQLNIQDCLITVEGYRAVKKFCRKCIIEHTNPGFFWAIWLVL